jgi:hypothetical protein
MRAYTGSEVFAVYFCLLQSYVLLLYMELNFLAVTSRSLWIAAGYGTVLIVTVALALAVPKIAIAQLMQIALVLMCLFSLCCIYYCRRLGFVDGNLRAQAGFLWFPVAFGACFASFGTGGAVILAALSLIALAKIHRRELGAFRIHSAAR